jgi:hypothetical protein
MKHLAEKYGFELLDEWNLPVHHTFWCKKCGDCLVDNAYTF